MATTGGIIKGSLYVAAFTLAAGSLFSPTIALADVGNGLSTIWNGAAGLVSGAATEMATETAAETITNSAAENTAAAAAAGMADPAL